MPFWRNSTMNLTKLAVATTAVVASIGVADSVAIGQDGAINAALLSASIIALNDNQVKSKLNLWRKKQTSAVKKKPR